MVKKFWLILGIVGVFAACGKKEPAAAPASAQPSQSINDVLGGGNKSDAPPPAPGAPPPQAAAPTDTPAAPGTAGVPMNPKEVKAAIDKYFETQARFPANWDQLISRKFLTSVPLDVHGKPLNFSECIQWYAKAQ